MITFGIIFVSALVYYYIGCLFYRTDCFNLDKVFDYIEEKLKITVFEDNGEVSKPDTTSDKMFFIFGWLLIILFMMFFASIKIFWKKIIIGPYYWATETKEVLK